MNTRPPLGGRPGIGATSEAPPQRAAGPRPAGPSGVPSRGAEPPAARDATRPIELGGAFAMALLAIVWAWWAWKQGGFFGSALYPGIVLLCGGLIVLLVAAPRTEWRPGAPLMIGLSALIGLGLWSLVSAVWSPVPDVAVEDGQRILAYALAFGLGAWLCRMLGSRVSLALAPLTLAAAAAGIGTAVSLVGADAVKDYLRVDGSLVFPLGYRNANAAFFAIALWPALGLAQARSLHWSLRGGALAVATLCLELAFLSQSRGSLIGAVAGIAIYVIAIPDRLRGLGWLALTALPAALVLPVLSDVYSAANDGPLANALTELHAAGRIALVTAGASALVAMLLAWLDGSRPPSHERVAIGNRIVAIAAAAVVLGAISFVFLTGDPVRWVDQRVEEFRSEGTPNLSEGSSRFTLNAGSDRFDAWRVAVDAAADEPLLGEGGGGFQYKYDRQRREEGQNILDAHSVTLEIASELGLPGLLLFVAALAAAAMGAIRARRAGHEAALLSAIALAAAAYWLAHASLDWFWTYPALTAPVLALLGSAAAADPRAGRALSAARMRVVPIATGIAAAFLALSAVPPYLSDRYLDDAVSSWRSDPHAAYADLADARSLNRLSIRPLLTEGAIATAAGDEPRAVHAFSEAVAERPQDWSAHYLLAKAYLPRSPERARAAALAANRRNPLSPRVDLLLRQLRRAGQGG